MLNLYVLIYALLLCGFTSYILIRIKKLLYQNERTLFALGQFTKPKDSHPKKSLPEPSDKDILEPVKEHKTEHEEEVIKEKNSSSIMACTKFTEKEVNQDYCLIEKIPELGCSVMIVADGIGSYYKSEVASKFVSEKLVEKIKLCDNIEVLNFKDLFEQISIELSESFKEEINALEDQNSAYGTTVICCIETEDEYIFAYLGNGGIFHIKGDFNNFPKRFFLPWNSINILNPHSTEEGGKNAMYKFISPTFSELQISPSIVKINKDTLGYGDIIMICTDGVYSYDEVQIGKDPKGKIWISGEEKVERFYNGLKEYFRNEDYSAPALEDMLNGYIEELQLNTLIDDDTTLAVLVSQKTLDFQNRINGHNEENKVK